MIEAPQLLFRGQLDTAETQKVYLCESDDGRFLRLSKSAYDLYRAVQQGVSFEEIANGQRVNSRTVTAADIETAYRVVLEKVLSITSKDRRPPSGFWLRFNIIPASLVAYASRILRVAYHPAIAVILVAFIIVSAWTTGSGIDANLDVSPETFWTGYLVFLGSLLAHELGHAAACSYHGASPGPIGATMYLFFPAFYSDVTSTWSLRRWQRVIVGVGGTYFQLVVAAGLSVAYSFHEWAPLQVAIVLIAGTCIISLNPILKFDGYWIVADTLGVNNLSKLPTFFLERAWRLIRRQPAPALPWPAVTLWLLALYSLASIAFWGWLISVIAVRSVALIDTLPLLMASIWRSTISWSAPESGVLTNLATSLFMLVFVGLMLFRPGLQLLILFLKRVQAARRHAL